MSKELTLIILFVAAVLEVGGDALIRTGLQSPTLAKRFEFILLGGFVLLSYGIVVNLPKWDFGQLLGIYITLFFLVAQLINYLSFSQKPTISTLVGGTLIMTGGLIISWWRV